MQPKHLGYALLVLAVLWSGFWFVARDRFAERLDELETKAVSQNIRLQHGGRTIGGFPFRLEARYEAPVVTGAVPGLGWGIRAAEGFLIAQPWRFGHVILHFNTAETALSLDWTGADDAAPREYTARFVADAIQASISGAGERLKRLSVDLQRAEGDATLFSIGAFRAEDMQLHFRWRPADGSDPESLTGPVLLEPVLRVKNMEFLGRSIGALGPTLDHLVLQTGLAGDSIPNRTRAGLEAWREAGGTLDVPLIDMAWGPFTVKGNGTVAIDEELRPIGAFSMEAEGLDAVIATLNAAGEIDNNAAELLRITFSLLMAGSDGGAVAFPVTLQEGIASVGPVGVARFGSLAAREN